MNLLRPFKLKDLSKVKFLIRILTMLSHYSEKADVRLWMSCLDFDK